jgi:hypothetical protein
MKKTDIAMLVLIAGVGILIAFFATKALLGDPSDDKITIYVTTAVDSSIIDPDPDIFHDKAINPTVEVIIGEDDNQIDFGDSDNVNIVDDGDDLDDPTE